MLVLPLEDSGGRIGNGYKFAGGNGFATLQRADHLPKVPLPHDLGTSN
jgi:hypothetical protein